jgi:two-component system, sensor histidine kinase and response regulator
VSSRIESRQLQILLVEDNPVNREMALAVLGSRGHTVSVAVNGLEAVELYRSHSYDVVLMDIQMPEMDGFTATALIRTIEEQTGRRTPIVAVTAHATQGDREECLARGMDAYISKPVRMAVLLEAIAAVTESSTPKAVPASDKKEGDHSTAVLDYDEALKQCVDDAELVERLFRKLLEEASRMQTAMEQALQANQPEELAKIAHRLKGAVATVAARRCYATAAALEAEARKPDMEKAKELYGVLRSDIDTLRTAIEQVLSQPLKN